jgi:hypothetical protein
MKQRTEARVSIFYIGVLGLNVLMKQQLQYIPVCRSLANRVFPHFKECFWKKTL